MISNSVPMLGRSAHAACIEVGGADAAAFLHAQLSQRIEGVARGTAPLAAWSDARGRVRAVVRVVPAEQGFVLLTHAERAAAVVAELSRYVLRAKLSLRLAPELEIWALLGDSGAWLAAHGVALPASPGSAATRDEAHWVRVGPELVDAVFPAGRAAALGAETGVALGAETGADTGTASGPPGAENGTALGAAPGAEIGAAIGAATRGEIELAEIRLGLPALAPGLEERYLPQMLNLDRLDAIAFDKGCFPGQEVIARTHNLGSVKRRARRFRLEAGAPPAPGAALVDADGGPVGDVIRAAPNGAGAELLAVVRLDMLARPILLDGDPPARVTELPLPYA